MPDLPDLPKLPDKPEDLGAPEILEETDLSGMSGMLSQLGSMQKDVSDHDKAVDGLHKDLPQLDRIEAYLKDILRVLHVEFYIRPRGE
jgi:hypothetical protein